MPNQTLKPLPNETVYRHLRMLAEYCTACAADDRERVKERKEAFADIARRLEALATSRPVRKLVDYGE